MANVEHESDKPDAEKEVIVPFEIEESKSQTDKAFNLGDSMAATAEKLDYNLKLSVEDDTVDL